MLAIFRCDASQKIGAGHAARCLALADAFKDASFDILFATNREAPEIFSTLKQHRIEIAPDEGASEPEWLGKLAQGASACLILDLREVDRDYETRCKRWTRKLSVITDFPDRQHDCDVLIDQTIGRDASEYAALVPESCKVLAGSQYALVGKSFVSLRDQARSRRKAESASRLLLAFGATDPFNYLGRLLPALLEHAPRAKIDIAAGSRPLEDVHALCEKHADRVSVLRSPDEMPRALLKADLAVGLAGASAWERCVLGLPTALFIPSDYYRLATGRLAATGAATIVGDNSFDAAAVSHKIADLAADSATLARMSNRAFELCDGGGATRIVNAMR